VLGKKRYVALSSDNTKLLHKKFLKGALPFLYSSNSMSVFGGKVDTIYAIEQ
jgi:hypothetical protein